MTSTPGEPPAVQGWVALALGLGCVVVSVLVWRGTWRSWVGGPTGSAPLFVFPAGALLAFDYAATFVLPEGRTGSRIASPLLLAAILVIVLGLWGPSWFGPRWYRERHAAGHGDARRGPAAGARAEQRGAGPQRAPSGEAGHVGGRRRCSSPGSAPPRAPASPTWCRGTCSSTPTRSCSAPRPPTTPSGPGPRSAPIPAGSVVTVEVTPTARTRVAQVRFPTVAIHTADATTHRFECARARAVADDLVGLYGARRTPG